MNLETLNYENNYLDPDSIFWNGIKFFYKANQLGIFDPEAFTMENDQYISKISTGQVLVAAATWWQPDKSVCGKDAAMYAIPGSNQYLSQIFPEDMIPGYGMANAFCISSN